jgi:Galactose oxidase, central domain
MSLTAQPVLSDSNCLIYHTGLAGLVLFTSGSLNVFTQQYEPNTWLWKSNAWSLICSGLSKNPPPRTNTSMAFDGTNAVLFGGKGVDSTNYRNDTWLLNSSDVWSQAIPNYNHLGLSVATVQTTVNNSTYPPTVVNTGTTNLGLNIRCNSYVAATSGGVLLMGGEDYNNLMYQQQFLWTHGSNTWTEQFPATFPTIRTGGAFASDGASNVVLFGGAGTSYLLNDLWLYTTGSGTWAKLTTNTPPSCRRNAAMAWNPNTSSFILFGGEDSSGDLLGDLYSLTIAGSVGTFTKLSITNAAGTAPARRAKACLCFNTATSQLSLYGGIGTGNTIFSDLWALSSSSGYTWVLLKNSL